ANNRATASLPSASGLTIMTSHQASLPRTSRCSSVRDGASFLLALLMMVSVSLRDLINDKSSCCSAEGETASGTMSGVRDISNMPMINISRLRPISRNSSLLLCSSAENLLDISINPLSHLFGVVGNNQVCTSALECDHGLHDNRLFIDHSSGSTGFDHRVFYAHVIHSQGTLRMCTNICQHLLVIDTRFNHQYIRTFQLVLQRFCQGFPTIGRVHLVSTARAFEGAVYRVAERAVKC